jgi:3-deoxy-D-manno-octulosonic-acid transferase
MVFLETEIWPSWLTEACRRGIKTGLVNGRISMRSVKRYRKFRSFFTEVLRNVDAFSMIMKEDASRIIGMGARPERVEINGNAKYDLLTKEADPAVEGEVRKILNLQPYQHVFVAGSTREGEEETVLDVYETVLKHFPDMVLIIAPRHIIRTAAIGSLLKSRGLEYQLRTELKAGGPVRKAPVIIMNTFGELFRFYSVGSINFCGASLVPLGGQNPLEAAVWSKVVFYGPHMEDFLDAKALLEKEEAGIEVSNAEAFAAKAVWFLSHPDSAKHHGMKAKDAIVRNQGAAEKHAKVIIRLLDQRNSTMSGSRGGSP